MAKRDLFLTSGNGALYQAWCGESGESGRSMDGQNLDQYAGLDGGIAYAGLVP